jgi:isopenicillin-N epimerase
MAAFPLPACDGELLQRRLYADFQVEVPITAWNGRHLVRISVQGYNTQSDIDILVKALGRLLPEVVR